MLENAIVRSMVMQEEDGPLRKIIFEEEGQELRAIAAPLAASPLEDTPEMVGSLEQRVQQFEKGVIETALNHAGGNIAAAARSLNVSRTTLQYKVQKYAIRFGVVSY
jgi:Transcriptional regulator containing PAS, AAA-type ATPase, and DNA-binding domains